MQKIILWGNVGSVDDELRHVGDKGSAVFGFSLATGKKGVTTWYRITCWGQKAEFASQYVRKGERVNVVGDLALREYTSKAGENKIQPEVRADEVNIAWTKHDQGDRPFTHGQQAAPAPRQRQPQPQRQQHTKQTWSGNVDEIPF